jgi:peptidoglycan/LPS O-acetylase OafA/YrhL
VEKNNNKFQGRLAELDGLRAISVLLVITVHMHDHIWRWLNGWQGVTIFFVLSGYLITTLALNEENQTGRIHLRAFYIRRAMRLFPLYYLVLGIYCVLIFGLAMNPEKRQVLAGALPFYLTYLQEVPYLFGVDGDRAVPFYQSWSLGIEEKFYLIWPPFIFVLLARARRFRVAAAAALVVTFGALSGAREWGALLHPYYHILVGCLLALLLQEAKWRARAESLVSRGASRAGVVIAFLALHFTQPHLHGASAAIVGIVYTFAAAALVAVVVMHDGLLRKALQLRALALLGTLSYGIYLVHVLALNVAEKVFRPGSGQWMISLFALLTACLISIAVAYVLHVTIEQRLIDLGRRWSRRFIRPREQPQSSPALLGSTGTGAAG